MREKLERWVETVAGSMIFQVVAVLVLNSILWERLFRHGQLPYRAYFEPVLAYEAIEVDAVKVLLLLPLLVLFLARRHTRWQDIDPSRHTRWFVMAVAGILTWTFTTYDVNLYFDQTHWLDRLLLFALWVALYFHPMAIVPFLVELLVIATQGHFPLPEGPWMWPDKRLPLDVLILFCSYLLLLAGLRRRTRPMLLPFLLLCLVGATYGHAAINKMRLGPSLLSWPLHDHLSNLVVSSNLAGNWLGWLDRSQLFGFAHVVEVLGVPMAVGTLLAEGGGLVILAHWRVTQAVLVGVVLLHLGILATSGIFFWKWIGVDLALLFYLWLLRRDAAASGDPDVVARPAVHRPRLAALGLLVTIFSPYYFHNVAFAWFDTRLVDHFEIYGVGESGARYRIDPRFFAPYDVIINQSRHFYAAPGPVLVGTYGTTLDWDLAEALESATPEDLPRIRRAFGRVHTSPPAAQMLFRFVHRYVVNAERRGGRRSALSLLAPPFHFQRSPYPDAFDFQEPLASVEIRFVEFLHQGDAIHQTLDVPVVRIEIGSPGSALPDE